MVEGGEGVWEGWNERIFEVPFQPKPFHDPCGHPGWGEGAREGAGIPHGAASGSRGAGMDPEGLGSPRRGVKGWRRGKTLLLPLESPRWDLEMLMGFSQLVSPPAP